MDAGFQVLGHASMMIKYAGKSLLVDPWLLGFCYWRSWWNFPKVQAGLLDSVLNIDYIFITHIHWDHWHGPTLKKFNRNIPIITHREPNSRSIDDLRKIGFKNIIILNHGEQYKLADGFTITPYQFGLFLNDSALVVETKDFKLLNANDCKIAGMPLRHIADKHGRFDFVFRSHSSANDRICHTIEGVEETEMDDNVHYARSFKIFMDILKPTYAIPFASNHCHLHKDVFDMNSYINDPFIIKEKINGLGGLSQTELKIMLTGDSWDHKDGFNINEANYKCFEYKMPYLHQYAADVSEKLNKYYERENSIKISQKTFTKFFDFFDQLPFWIKSKNKQFLFLLELKWDSKKETHIVFPFKKEVHPASPDETYPVKVSMPVIIFRDAIYQNMSHHSGISKRNRYIYRSVADFRQFTRLMGALELIELGFYPLRPGYIGRLLVNYARRWREIFVYANAFYQKIFLRRKIYTIEEEILLNT